MAVDTAVPDIWVSAVAGIVPIVTVKRPAEVSGATAERILTTAELTYISSSSASSTEQK